MRPGQAPLLLLLLLPPSLSSIRCYTDLEATQGNSMECGMATGCVKIYKKAYEFDPMGKFIPPDKRGADVQLFRGCFLISTPDICYDSKSRLSYCWCSAKDLCNSAPLLLLPQPSLLILLPLLLLFPLFLL